MTKKQKLILIFNDVFVFLSTFLYLLIFCIKDVTPGYIFIATSIVNIIIKLLFGYRNITKKQFIINDVSILVITGLVFAGIILGLDLFDLNFISSITFSTIFIIYIMCIVFIDIFIFKEHINGR